MKTFRQDLEELINKHGMEDGNNTPDFILAEYLTDCLRAFDKTMKRRDIWYGKKLCREIVDRNNDDQQKIMDVIDYNSMCARATLYPGKSIAEVEDIQFMNRVEESYKFINSVLLGTMPMNNRQTREWVQKTLEGRLNKYNVVAKCNDENNPSDVIDNCLLVARIMRNNPDKSPGFRFMDLIFGEELRVKEYHMQHYFDNAIYAYIGKGI
jgi:hypothetical protein